MMNQRAARPLILVALIPLLGGAQGGGKKPVTLDDVISYRYSPGVTPTWAPDGKSFLYEQAEAVYRYGVEERKPHEWFRPERLEAKAVAPQTSREFGWQNRRVTAASYQWFPNSRDLLAAVRGDLFVVHQDGSFDAVTQTPIAEEDPKLSPDGKQVLYRSQSNLYVLDLASKHVKQVTSDGSATLLNGELDWVYPEELELGTATWWSPDSKQIAYLQFDVSHEFIYPQSDLTGERALAEPERYPQAGTPNALVQLGVVSAEGGETHWMQTGEKSDALLARVAWLPSGSQLAVERFNRLQDKLDLLSCDPVAGTARTILHEQSKTWIMVADNLFFLKSRPEFLWTSERSGFRHIYRYSNTGELLGQLTRGDWEVKTIAGIDETHGRVAYTSSQLSPLETQLYSVDLKGGEAVLLTKDRGDHEIHANEEGSYFVDRYSSLTEPGETTLHDATGQRLAVLQPKDPAVEKYDLLPSEIVPIKTSDGVTLYGKLVKPASFRTGVKYPLVVYVYGGPGVQSIRNRFYGASWEQALANRGYVVWQLDNRGSNGRGLAFEAPIFHQLGTQEVADQRAGVEHLIAMGLVDPQRIGITGWSYGGYMTIHSLLLAPDIFKVGVAGAPVNDWHNYDTIYTERYMGLPDVNKAGYEASSNVQNASKLAGKLLIVHNIEDDNVLFQNTMQLASALEKSGKPFFMQVYPQKSHGVGGPFRRSLYEEMTAFLDANLKPGSEATGR